MNKGFIKGINIKVNIRTQIQAVLNTKRNKTPKKTDYTEKKPQSIEHDMVNKYNKNNKTVKI